MKKLAFVLLITGSLFVACSDDDTIKNDSVIAVDELSFLGRWKLVGITGETLGACDRSSYIAFNEEGNFEERSSGSDGFSVTKPDGGSASVTTCSVVTDKGDYNYSESSNEITFTYDTGTDIAKVTQEGEELILSYDNGEYVASYERESEESVIAAPDPLVAKWDFIASIDNGVTTEVQAGDCYESAYIAFGVEGVYLSDFPVDDNGQCRSNEGCAEYSHNGSTITIIADTGEISTSYEIDGDLLTIDRSRDGTYFERFKKSSN